MKRIVAAALAMSMLSGTISAGAVSISDTIETRNGNQVTFSGTASEANSKLMVKIYNDSYGENNTAGFVKFDTVKTNGDGSFEFSVVMPEELSDKQTSSGKYKVVLSDGIKSAPWQFLYKNTDDSKPVYKILKEKDATELITQMQGTFADEAAMVGVDTTAYNKLTPAQQKTVCEMFVQNRGNENEVQLLNKCIYSQYILVCSENERVLTLKKLNPSYGKCQIRTLSENDKKKVSDYMAGCKIEVFEDINKMFGRGAVLTELSNARKDDITEILSANNELLELAATSEYISYLKLSVDDRQKTNEKIVVSLGGKVVSLSELKSILSASITKQDLPDNSNKVSTSTSVAPAPTQSNVSNNKTTNFGDIDNVKWAQEAINTLAAKGIVSGVADNQFAPDSNVTREAFVKMILLSTNIFEKGHTSTFEDVDNSQWYGEYIGCAQNKNIVTGITDTQFGVGMSITRQDMAVMLVRSANATGISLGKIRNYDNFADQEEIADYAVEAVKTLYCAGVINGDENGNFCPNNSLTRAEAAKVIYEMCFSAKKKSNTYSSQTAVTDSEYKKNVKFLTGVEIISDDYLKINESENISAGSFINTAVTLTQKDLFSGDSLGDIAKSIAKSYGMINDNYSDSDTLTVGEAAEILVRSIGYAAIVEDGNYWSWASKLKILDGIYQSADEVLTAKSAVTMFKNTAFATPAVAEYGTNLSIKVLQGETVLETVKGIYKDTGIVTANEITSLYEPDGLRENEIKIDAVKYQCYTSEYNDYLGYRVLFYAKEDEDDDVLKYAEIISDKTTVIKAEEFESVSSDFRTIKYDDGKRIKSLDISATPNVIFNGKYYSDYTTDDFQIESGDITVVKNSSSDSVDTIIINSYETMIFDRLSYDKNKIYNKYSHSGVTTEINFEDADYIIIKNDEEISLADLKEWDVISLRASKSGSDPYYKLIVSDIREEALTESYSQSDKTVTSIGYIYDIAKSYYDSFNENKGVGEMLKLGENQIYLLDAFGRVAVVLADESSQNNEYMYIINAYLEDDGFSDGRIKYYDINTQQIIKAEFADKVRIDEVRYSKSKLKESPLFDADGNCSAQLAQIETDADGNVKKITTAASVTEADASRFTKTRISTDWIYENSSFNYEAFLTGATQILCVPNSGDEEGYYVLDRTMYENDPIKTLAAAVTAYDIDKFMRTDMVVVNYDDKGTIDVSDSLQIFVVEQIFEALDEDDQAMRMLRGSIGNYEGMEFFITDDNLLTDIAPGDALYVSFDRKGKIKYAERIFSLKQVLDAENSYEAAKKTLQTDRNSKTQLLTGWIDNVDLNAGDNENMLMLDGTTMLPIRLNGSSAKVIVYDAQSKKTSVENINAVEKGDLAIIRLRYSTVKAIVVIKM